MSFLHASKSFTSHDIQDEVLELMSHQILRSMISDILHNKATFSIIVDETTDVATKEKVSICIRWLSDDLTPLKIL